MGDSHNEKGDRFHRPDGIMPLDHSGFFDQPEFTLSSYPFLDQREDMDFHSHYGSRIANGPVQDDNYLQRGFYGAAPSNLHGVMLPSSHSRHSISDMNLVYTSVQHPDQHFSLQTPEMSVDFNGQAVSQTNGQYDYMPFQYELQQSSHQPFLHQTVVENQERDDDNESVGSATTDCDSDCGLADPCTEESCAGRDDACTDRHCPEKDCPDTNCPEKMPTEVVVAAATLAAFGGGPAPQQGHDTTQQGIAGQGLSSSQQAFFDEMDGMFGMAAFKPLDIVKHIGVAHNDPASSNCTRPCLIDNPQVFQYFQHCPFPNSFDFQLDSCSDLDNSFLMNSLNADGSINFTSHNHVGFEGCGAEISNPEALVEHFNAQHRHVFENVLAQGNAYSGSTLPQISPRTLSSSSSKALELSLSSITHSPQGPFPPTPLSLCQDVPDSSKPPGHHSRSSTVSQGGTGNEYEQQCLWCNPETGERCGRIFQDSEALFAHVNGEHIQKLEKGAQGFLCHWENCKRRGDGKEGFPQRSKIERHMHTHIGRKPFECKSCGQRFSAQQALTQHLLIHSDEKPLRCDWEGCGKTFRQQSALTMHRRIHTGDKPLKCPVCGKAFSESSNLSKHKRIHETKGRFSCQEPGCNRSFHRLDQLRRHMKLHPAGDKKMKEEIISGIDDLMNVLPSPLDAGNESGEPTRKKRSR